MKIMMKIAMTTRRHLKGRVFLKGRATAGAPASAWKPGNIDIVCIVYLKINIVLKKSENE